MGKSIGKGAALAGGVLAGLAGLAAATGAALIQRPLPQTAGTLAVPGLRAPVEIVRDRWGVPHLYAESNADLFFAQGYVHAQDFLVMTPKNSPSIPRQPAHSRSTFRRGQRWTWRKR